ncbi:endonuclease NucS [archaeon CG_4_10_14_0_2_um_filter_Archaea_38_6]|nr:MAG: endonuclease NucS [archaeon CG06_land_8_20_14_3_00_37_11]PJA21744.1 MAG: endonuclease NucS [archaeon CG_4_10_14_0_2_um_filter_Archaea_38_6]
MDLTEAFHSLEKSVSKKFISVIFCSCEIEYEGRAKSFLGEGDRMIIIKHDYTVLIHRPDGTNPVNWMLQGSGISVSMEKDVLTLDCSSLKPFGNMKINIFEVYSLTSAPLVDTEQLKLIGSEKDMSDMIYSNPLLISDDFVPIRREEQTDYGFLDVYGHDGNGNLVIVECKRYTAGLDSVTQLRRYVERVKKSKGVGNVKGVIAAPNISSNALKMLNDWGFEYRNVSPPHTFVCDSFNQKRLKDF